MKKAIVYETHNYRYSFSTLNRFDGSTRDITHVGSPPWGPNDKVPFAFSKRTMSVSTAARNHVGKKATKPKLKTALALPSRVVSVDAVSKNWKQLLPVVCCLCLVSIVELFAVSL